jgi:murein DD-endopeptidase MepM/ murein hydrolase activator NlpD
MRKSKIKNFESCIFILLFAFCILNFIGCATTSLVMPPKLEAMPGIYHRVERGQTLWGISKIYSIDLDEVVKINRITDATNIEIGQLIFIPHRKKPESLSRELPAEDFMWPVKGKVILTFGQTSHNMINKGINIQADSGSAVVAARSGKVVFYSPDFTGFGETIIIDHGDGFSTVYARNSQVFVKVGNEVKKGALIAKLGSSGKRDKNICLHFEIRKGFISQNPYFYLPR